jgi:hypothetical protein
MKATSKPIPFARFFILVLAEHLAFAIPTLGILLLFQLLELKVALFLFTIFVLSLPITGLIAWLIAKGSNWANTGAALKAAGGVSGQPYGLLMGGFLGSHFFGTVGALLMAVGFVVLGSLAGIVLGSCIANRYTGVRAGVVR